MESTGLLKLDFKVYFLTYRDTEEKASVAKEVRHSVENGVNDTNCFNTIVSFVEESEIHSDLVHKIKI